MRERARRLVRRLPPGPGQLVTWAMLVAVLTTLGLHQPARASGALLVVIVLLLGAAVAAASLTWNQDLWRAFGGIVGAGLLGFLVASTGGANSYYQDALLAVPIVSALSLSLRMTLTNLAVTLLVAASPAVYGDVPATFAPDLIADAIVWTGVTIAVYSQTQRLRRQRRELRVLDELKTSFLESMSHQVRTPLTGILGAAVTMAQHGEKLDADTRETMVDVIHRHALRLDALIENVLDVAGLSAGQLQVQHEPADLASLVADALVAFEKTDRVVQVSIPDVTVLADRRQLRRAFFNILDNAFRHTPSGTRIDVIGQVREPAVLVIVADRGPGIPRQIVDSLFAPFTRGPVGSDPNPGVGTGLTIARGIIELHGGRVEVQDRPGGGAMFLVELPTSAAASRHRKEPTTPSANLP